MAPVTAAELPSIVQALEAAYSAQVTVVVPSEAIVHVRQPVPAFVVMQKDAGPDAARAEFERLSALTFCGRSGGSVSLRHYRENPSAHLSTLVLCPECERLVG